MKLTTHFYLEEFTNSQTATRFGINNTPSPAHIENLRVTAKGLEEVRKILGNKPMYISSGFRSPELNRKIRGSSTSHHMQGFAADFVCWKFGTPREIMEKLKDSGLEYDQLIEEGTWVHISFHPRMKQQTLVATFNRSGKATYTQV